jgi:hypothetical protein
MDVVTDEINVVEVIVTVKSGNVSELKDLVHNHGKDELHRVTSTYLSGAGASMLHWAAECGQLEALQYILAENMVNVDHKDDQGATALHWASGVWQLNSTTANQVIGIAWLMCVCVSVRAGGPCCMYRAAVASQCRCQPRRSQWRDGVALLCIEWTYGSSSFPTAPKRCSQHPLHRIVVHAVALGHAQPTCAIGGCVR